MSKVFFDPFEGENYDRDFKDTSKRIMILGESHYIEDACYLNNHKNNECSKMTEAVVWKYLKNRQCSEEDP